MRTLLDATAQVLTDVGLDGLSTNKVAKRAHVAVGSIYQYFPNKEALLDALLEDRLERLGELARTRMAALESQDFPAAAEAMLRAVVEFFAGEPGLAPLLVSHALYASDRGVAGRVRAEADSAARAFLDGLDDLAVPDLDVAIFVSANVTGVFGALLANPDLDPRQRERMIDEIVRMLSLWMLTPG